MLGTFLTRNREWQHRTFLQKFGRLVYGQGTVRLGPHWACIHSLLSFSHYEARCIHSTLCDEVFMFLFISR
jgi:hypothetical protein